MAQPKLTPEQWAEASQAASETQRAVPDWIKRLETLLRFLLDLSRSGGASLDMADVAVCLVRVDEADQSNLKARLLRGLQAILDLAELIPGDQPDEIIRGIKKVVEDSELLDLLFNWIIRTNGRSINAVESERAVFQAQGINWETIRRIAELVSWFFKDR